VGWEEEEELLDTLGLLALGGEKGFDDVTEPMADWFKFWRGW
jgi:hypothetical protein